jgi:lactate dehydrogenase-like 2-hydroxyacid dehydrogenase
MKPDIYFLDEPVKKDEFLKLCTEAQTPKNASIIYTHRTQIPEGCEPSLVICPCTSTKHLSYNGYIIYLNDKAYLKENVHSTAEFTICAMMNALRLHGDELYHTRVGLIGGAGRIGQQVCEKLYGLTKTVPIVYDRESVLKELKGKCIQTNWYSDLFEECDLISIHLSEEGNKNLINSWFLKEMTDKGVKYLINTSRASVLEPKSLIDFLPKFNYVFLDVTEGYPEDVMEVLNTYQEITNYTRLLITNHVAGSCVPSRLATDSYVLGKLKSWIDLEFYLASLRWAQAGGMTIC